MMWVLFAAFAVCVVARALKEDVAWMVNVPESWRPIVVLVLGQVAGVAAALAAGVPAREAILGGLGAAAPAMGGMLVESTRSKP